MNPMISTVQNLFLRMSVIVCINELYLLSTHTAAVGKSLGQETMNEPLKRNFEVSEFLVT